MRLVTLCSINEVHKQKYYHLHVGFEKNAKNLMKDCPNYQDIISSYVQSYNLKELIFIIVFLKLIYL